jgi:predicted AAA+ superfamily ATPase
MTISRDVLQQFQAWLRAPDRKPLIVRGARQVGKSHSVREFGKLQFKNICEVNFEKDRQVRAVFSNLDPEKIISQLSLYYNQPIDLHDTLLFLDEIQDCPDALLALRYFYEKQPQRAVIAAGSLLDLELARDKELSFPVGRVEYLFLHPVSFSEFLDYTGNQRYREFIAQMELSQEVPPLVHQKLLELFGTYIVTGGMPAVIRQYVEAPTSLRFKAVQADILRSYKDDFKKYRSRIDYERLEQIFDTLARICGRRFKYTECGADFSQQTVRKALTLFAQAKLITHVHASHANGLPLGAELDTREHKIIFLDVGLLSALLGANSTAASHWNIDLVNSGTIGEQIVGQEFLAYTQHLISPVDTGAVLEPALYFWRRDKIGGSAEVDYLVLIRGTVIPVEVKAGTTGKLRSLRSFIEARRAPYGIRISQHPLSYTDQVLSVPYYAISQLSRIAKSLG